MKCNTTLCAFLLAVLFCCALASNDPCSVLGLASWYDVVVVGSGPGGSVSARRLAESDSRLEVIQIERGISWEECPQCQLSDLTELDVILGEPDLFIPSVPQTGLNNIVIDLEDHAVQGGGSSVNGMFWIRPDGPNYYDNYFPTNWNWEEMKIWHAISENYSYPNGYYGPGNHFDYAANFRGKTGLVGVTQEDTTWGGANVDYVGRFIDVATEIWPNILHSKNQSMNNGNNPGIGVMPVEHSFNPPSRHSAYSAYILSYTGTNLKAISHVRVQRILFYPHSSIVSGVEIAFINTTTAATISSACNISTHNVIVSAGALNTPKLLKLSGVGPRAELESFDIPVVHDLPDVGEHLDDQFAIVDLVDNTTSSGNGSYPASPYSSYGLLFWNTQDVVGVQPNMAMNVVGGGPVMVFVFFTVYLNSRGTVGLNSANPDVPAKVDPRYLTNHTDYANLGLMLRQALPIIYRMGLKEGVNPCLTHNCTTNDQLLDTYLRYANGGGFTYSPGYHFTGTAALGKVIDPHTMKVYGTTGLFVNDGSALVRTPGQNTQNPIYACAEKGIQLIKHHLRR